MAKTPSTPVAKLVHDLGGPQTVADNLKTSPGAVRMWIHRRVVPRAVWPELLEVYPELTLDKLRLIEARAA